MPKRKLRVLIADSHYLIAMDLERILTETGECEVGICPIVELQEKLLLDRYDIVMLDAVASLTLNLQNVDAVASTGARIVFLTTIDDFHQAYPPLQGYSTLQKPFDPDAVTAVISKFRHEIEAERQQTD